MDSAFSDALGSAFPGFTYVRSQYGLSGPGSCAAESLCQPYSLLYEVQMGFSGQRCFGVRIPGFHLRYTSVSP